MNLSLGRRERVLLDEVRAKRRRGERADGLMIVGTCCGAQLWEWLAGNDRLSIKE
jgi:hypothetical protein